MKIAFLAGANSIHSIRWIKYFADRGHTITWISLAPPTAEAKELIPKTNFYEIKPSPLSDVNGPFALCYLPLAVSQIKKIIKNEKPDLLHAHSAGTYGLVGALTDFRPFVLTIWGSDILLTAGLKKMSVRYALKRADLITYDGYNAEKKLLEFGVEPGKIREVRFGIEVEKFLPKAYGLRSNGLKIISLRSLIPIYDVETLIRAAAIVTKKIPQVEFVIAGEGRERERLERLAGNNVKFTGRYQPEDLPRMLAGADIYVTTALSESGLAASTSEAMAAGLPVIAADAGDNRQWIEGKGGFVVPPKNPAALAEKIIYLAENPTARKKFGEYNRRITLEKNDYRKEMAKMEEIYLSLVPTKR